MLDPVVVRSEIGGGERLAALVRRPARRVPLGDVALVRAQGDLGVDRRRADAAAREKHERLTARKRREAERPPDVVCGLRLPAREVGRRPVRPALEEEDVPPAPRKLTGHHAATGAGSDDDDVELAVHGIPRYDQSLFRRVASGVLKSISAHAPGPGLPDATKSL